MTLPLIKFRSPYWLAPTSKALSYVVLPLDCCLRDIGWRALTVAIEPQCILRNCAVRRLCAGELTGGWARVSGCDVRKTSIAREHSSSQSYLAANQQQEG